MSIAFRAGAQVDALYEQIEQTIAQELLKLGTSPVPTQPTVIPAQLAQLRRRMAQIEQSCQLIRYQLQVLEHDLETEFLRSRLRPLESAVYDYQRLIGASEGCQQLLLSIVRLHQSARDDLRLVLEGHFAGPIQRLERYLGQAEEIAERLSKLSQGFGLANLHQAYASMDAELRRLGDELDDIAD